MRAISIAVAIGLFAGEARAEPVRDHPFYIAVASVGGVGGLANTIGALVYAIQDRSFHSPWVATIVLSSSICAAMAGQLIIDAKNGEGSVALNVVGIVGFLVASLWPAAWLMRSALSDVPFGEPFDPELPEEEPAE
jgi:hypothetical protein